MLFNERKKYVFISVPKTGTSAIEKHLTEQDEEVSLNKVKISDDSWRRVTKHIPVQDVKDLLGKKASEFRFVAFFRDPRELAVSKYNWYRNGWPRKRWEERTLPLFTRNKNWWRPSLAQKVLAAKYLPPRVWLSLYPFKPNAYFLLNKNGDLGVDFLGHFETLQEDFISIFTKLGYVTEDLRLPQVNVAKYDDYDIDQRLIDRVAQKRCPDDMDIVKKVFLNKVTPS